MTIAPGDRSGLSSEDIDYLLDEIYGEDRVLYGSDFAENPESATTINRPQNTRPYRRRGQRRVRLRFAAVAVTVLALAVVLTNQTVILTHKYADPAPPTMFMATSPDGEAVYEHVHINHISRYILAATIVHEDHMIGHRSGPFDWDDVLDRADDYTGQKGTYLGGSTIPVQLQKNLLFPRYPVDGIGPSPVNRVLKALWKAPQLPLSYQVSWTLSPAEQLDLYLNTAQFGREVYGVCAATWYYWDTPPSRVTPHQAGQLMGLLPISNLATRAPGGGIDMSHPYVWDLVNGAANVWLPRELESAGGWEPVTASVGIEDEAADHADDHTHPGCRTMPEDVRTLIEQGR